MSRLLGGRYRLGDRLGPGGAGTVWRAHDELLDRDVAVKELDVGGLSGEEFARLRDRMQRETRAVAGHPGVVTVHEVIEQDDRPWIVMELVDGRPLTDVIASDGPLPPGDTARIGAQVLSVLDRAHRAGVVHRDVSPATVLVEPGGRAVLTGFGVAAFEESTPTADGVGGPGSPDYLAPERVTGRDPGPASDVWSLGATLYTAVEGRPPFARPTSGGTLHAAVEDTPPGPRRAGPLGPAVAALLRKEPEARPTTDQAHRLLAAVASGSLPGAAASYGPVAAEDRPGGSEAETAPLAAAAGEGTGEGGHRRGRPSGVLVTAAVLLLLLSAAGLMYGLVNGDGMTLTVALAWVGLGVAAAVLLAALHRSGQDAAAVAGAVVLLAAVGGVYGWSHGAERAPVALAAAVGLVAAAVMAVLLHRGGRTGAAVAALLVPLLSAGGLASAMYGDFWYRTSVPDQPTTAVAPVTPATPTAPTAPTAPAEPVTPTAPAPGTPTAPTTTAPTPTPTTPTPTTPPPGSPGTSPAPFGYQWVDDPAGFRVAVPQGWPRTVADPWILYTPDANDHLLSFSVRPGAGVVPGSHLLALEQESGIPLADYRRIALTANTYQGGPGALWEFTWTAAGQPRHAAVQAYIAPNGNEYLIYVAYPEVDWPAGLQLFDSVLTTFTPR
ncbi:serine/threonine-protein kinase [Kitasatospora sp. NPDC054939]